MKFNDNDESRLINVA